MRMKFWLVVLALPCMALPSVAGAQVWEKTIAPGLTYHMEVDASKPLIFHALRVSLVGGAQVQTQVAGGTINEAGTTKGRLSPSAMRDQAKAVAAINGDFFSYQHGAPIGMMVRDGELVTSPAKSRAVFGWGEGAAMGFGTWQASASIGGKQISIDSLNQPTGQNRLHLFTSVEGDLTVPADATTVVLKVAAKPMTPTGSISGEVQLVALGAQSIHIADGQYVLVARGTRADELGGIRPGQQAEISWKAGGFDWTKISQATGGGPILVRDGKSYIDAVEEGFNADFISRNPRSAIGCTAMGDLWIVAIDGRQQISAGVTLDEEARVMLSLGCVDAMNLDGGGSTLLNLLGVTLNRPIGSAAERPVASGLLIFAKLPKPIDGDWAIVTPPSIAIGDSPEIRLTLNGKVQAQTDVIWGAVGPAWIDQGGGLHPLAAGKVTITAYSGGHLISLDVTIRASKASPPPKGNGS
jgi:hypothetical protein